VALRRESDRREAADRLREAEEAAQEAARARQAEETAREEAARARQAGEAAREEAGFRQDEAMATSEAARDEAAGASLGPTPSGDTQATTSGAAGEEAAGASLGPTPSGDAQDQPGPGDIPESGTSIGGPSRVASSPRRLFPTPSIAPLNAEPLLQALAAANTTVLDGLSAQVEVLQAERAELDAA
jgi:hypothetical protein